jgi:hypothetical protein
LGGRVLQAIQDVEETIERIPTRREAGRARVWYCLFEADPERTWDSLIKDRSTRFSYARERVREDDAEIFARHR